MEGSSISIVVVASTSGSVLNEVLKNEFFRNCVHSIVTDRPCPSTQVAQAHGVETVNLENTGNESFGDALLEYCERNKPDYVFAYYLDFFSKRFRDAYKDRIVNFHPSVLPAFKGMDAFNDNISYHARFLGNTVEFIDQVMDEGKIIMQTVCPNDLTKSVAENRHEVFVQQCKTVIQVARWLAEGRISVDGRKVTVEGARFDSAQFSPALEFEDAILLDPPAPNF